MNSQVENWISYADQTRKTKFESSWEMNNVHYVLGISSNNSIDDEDWNW